jgi:sugar diacid utilization regulator
MHERLHGVMLTGGGLPEVAAVTEELLGGDLAVLDAAGLEVVVVGDADRAAAAVEALRAEHGPVPAAAPAVGPGAALRTTVPPDGTPVTAVPVLAGTEALGTVLFAGRDLDDLEVRLLERSAVVTALLLLRERSIAEAEQRVRGELVDDLVASPQRDPDALHRRAAHLGLDLRTPYVVVVARPATPEGLVSALRGAALAGAPRTGLHAQHEGDLVLLVRADTETAPGAASRVAAELRERLPGCTVGAAGPGTGTGDVPGLYRDAVRCCEVLLHLGRDGQSASADDLGVYGLLLGVAGGADVARFVRRTVGPVLDYDRERGSELARTLLTWYSCGGNLTRTAGELYVHVNTLYQRLDRVTQLLGEGWRAGDGALQTHLALQAHRALGADDPRRPQSGTTG